MIKTRTRVLFTLEADIDPKAKWGKRPDYFVHMIEQHLLSGPARDFNPEIKVINKQQWHVDENVPSSTPKKGKEAREEMQKEIKPKRTRTRRTKAA